MFVVANYDPPGNFIGSFKENVPPIGGFTSSEVEVQEDLDKDEIFSEFATAMLKHHNEYRRKHGAPKLRYCLMKYF